MGVKERTEKRKTEKMSDLAFRMMEVAFKVIDFIYPYIKRRVEKFAVEKGMTVVDYGCGPGRYATRFAELVGEKGKVYAVDVHELAIEGVRKRMGKYNISNIEPVLIEGYDSTLPDSIADVVCAIDMFFIIKKPTEFLAELNRITKSDGKLVIDDGHQSRSVTKTKILDSGFWEIVEETKELLKSKLSYKKALDFVNSSISKGLDNVEIKLFKTRVLCHINKYAEALDILENEIDYKQYQDEEGLYLSASFIVAFAYTALGNAKKAIKIVDKILDDHPDHPIPLAA